ncbi:hypothetical protein CFP66_25990 [Pseudonocardia sp. MH-G8]|nr:hypothetical protein CFP66_25990 [Pseudonocardia sp. MH-G8]
MSGVGSFLNPAHVYIVMERTALISESGDHDGEPAREPHVSAVARALTYDSHPRQGIDEHRSSGLER